MYACMYVCVCAYVCVCVVVVCVEVGKREEEDEEEERGKGDLSKQQGLIIKKSVRDRNSCFLFFEISMPFFVFLPPLTSIVLLVR